MANTEPGLLKPVLSPIKSLVGTHSYLAPKEIVNALRVQLVPALNKY